MSIYEGIWVPLVTPFHQGKPDLDKVQQLTRQLMTAGIHGLVVCGTTGEAATLTDNEQTALLAAVLEVSKNSCPVLMGISGSDTRVLAEKVRAYSNQHLQGFLVSAPSYLRPSQEGVRQHFESIAKATEKDIVLYNVPARTGVNIDLSTVIALEKQTNIIAIKESSGNLTKMMGLVNCSHLKVLCGDDAMLLDTLSMGGQGAISAAAHVRPDLFVQLYELIRADYFPEAQALFAEMQPLIRLLFSESNPAPVKAALAMQGLIQEELRLPMTAMSLAGKIKLANELERLADLVLPVKARPMPTPVINNIRSLRMVR
ncbi:4-hydroxy-tetrahydrodipicolinate synthase [Undibacterium sp. TS12]|uniref:4-hydroxy-tetrahydrodipicolinate synthase n=1 Tax=Undibacterium sp. TS12 TaxID=2908202 RepID=UPI001F4D1097|nr:4-hydroxy-tetrahydrodipicolinate synthase [Undibacterium sp. TS12]MCH8621465.1 4-hydroxy-tetrahydrodipicolinate synthase [Undibacterium sp. TS12]